MHELANKKKPFSHTEHSGPVNPSAHSKSTTPLLFDAWTGALGCPDGATPSAAASAATPLSVPVAGIFALLVASSTLDIVSLLSETFPGHEFRNLHWKTCAASEIVYVRSVTYDV